MLRQVCLLKTYKIKNIATERTKIYICIY
uniref:Uncharacterized protein n=1 Tax=Rhizophora mucronata TaxID=61149 RepID=A0A2P2JBP0_RHIMU